MKKQSLFSFWCIVALMLLYGLGGCGNYLDIKPDKRLVTPETLGDLQALMDHYSNIYLDPSIGEVSSGDYYLTDADWASISTETDRRTYLWEREGIYPNSPPDWFRPYRNVYYANVVLETLGKIERNNQNGEQWDHLHGQASFLRARSFLSLVVLFGPAYDPSESAGDLGIPLRLSSDFNKVSTRATVEETYSQIIRDLEQAIDFLPVVPIHVYRPSRPAANALLARTYLFMRDYARCLQYADACLQQKTDLLDFNELDASQTYPVPQFNPEIIYQSLLSSRVIAENIAKIDPALQASYTAGDLRRTIYFRTNADGTWAFRGSPTSPPFLFSGLAVGEVYLMRAECHARQNAIDLALSDLNTLLARRWDQDVFEPVTATNKDELLDIILSERRKELVMRGLRFPDVKRLNREGYNIGFERIIDGVTYDLIPNSSGFSLPIPDNVVELAGVSQNP